MRFAVRLMLIAVVLFMANGTAPLNMPLSPAQAGCEQAIAELQSALTAAAARAEPITEGFLSVDPIRARRTVPSSPWSADASCDASIPFSDGVRDRVPTDQRRAIRLTYRGAPASHSRAEPPDSPRLPS